MNSKTISAFCGAALASAAFLIALPLSQRDAQAQETNPDSPPAVAKATAVSSPEEYKMMSLAPFQHDPTTQRMERELNKLAAEGWTVKTGVGIALVLSR